ncbi:serine hydrolase domain-containing protein [Paenibacillus sp. GCM10027626]|uniref:serine hydrolase domain-containing protein n=1 Tax=Paenibacillus sp. GCM10027626 TaxID=3273411 RepID=UPI00363E69E3
MELQMDIPENHRLSSKALVEFFTRIEQLKLEVNSFILLQDGKVTAQFWRPPYRKDHPQLLYSLSKSFTSIAAGIAWDNGFLDLDDKVISFFPEKLPGNISPNLAKMTVHHLLSMNAGHHDNIYAAVAKEQDWVKTFLSLDVEHEPGSYYRYSTHATYMLSAIIEQVTGQNMVDFLMPRLFEPLGIPRPSWETCPLGITAGGMGLSISTEGIAKFGLMLLNKGVYEGKRIVSEQYIRLATTEQSDNRAGAERIDSAQGYGYQFHLCRRGCYRGDGAFGQLCFVVPKEKIVIAATSSFKNMKSLQTLLDLIYEHIFDQLDSNVFYSPEDHFELRNLLSNFPNAVPALNPVPENLPIENTCSYVMNENPRGLKKLSFHLKAEHLELQAFYGDDRDNILPFNFTKAVHAKDVFHKDLSLHLQEVVTFASWQDEMTLQLTLFYIETPYVVTYTIIFHEQTIDLQFNINVALNISEYSVTGNLKDVQV